MRQRRVSSEPPLQLTAGQRNGFPKRRTNGFNTCKLLSCGRDFSQHGWSLGEATAKRSHDILICAGGFRISGISWPVRFLFHGHPLTPVLPGRLPTCRYHVETTISLIGITGMAHAPERSLVDEAKDGDQGAFGSLYQQYARMVHGILLARVPRSEVEDLVQDVFLLAWRRLRSLRDSHAFGGWLAMIARNQAIDYHRQAPKLVELNPTLLKERPPEPEALAVLDTIRNLPDAYRETLMLRLVEGLTGPEIAEQTGLTPDSVRVNLHRGMKILREKIEGRSAQ